MEEPELRKAQGWCSENNTGTAVLAVKTVKRMCPISKQPLF